MSQHKLLVSGALFLAASLGRVSETHAQAFGPFIQALRTPPSPGLIFEPSISADGSRIVFRASADFTGQNPDKSFEIFVRNLVTGQIIQVTHIPFGVDIPKEPTIAPDNRRVLFLSGWDYIAGTLGITTQLWEADLVTGLFRQITHSDFEGAPITHARLSGDGEFATFAARINPTGANPDFSLEVFRANIATREYVQISNNAILTADFPDIDGDGSRIVWSDRANYDGTNANGGLEIWLWDERAGISHVTNQTSGVLLSTRPKIDYAGRFVTFISYFDFSGAQAVGSKVFLADTQTGSIKLLSNPGATSGGLDYPDSEISPDGTIVVFETTKNLTGHNPDGNRELFAYHTPTGRLEQVTESTGGLFLTGLNSSAIYRYADISLNNRLVYRSEQDLDPLVNNESLYSLHLFVTVP